MVAPWEGTLCLAEKQAVVCGSLAPGWILTCMCMDLWSYMDFCLLEVGWQSGERRDITFRDPTVGQRQRNFQEETRAGTQADLQEMEKNFSLGTHMLMRGRFLYLRKLDLTRFWFLESDFWTESKDNPPCKGTMGGSSVSSWRSCIKCKCSRMFSRKPLGLRIKIPSPYFFLELADLFLELADLPCICLLFVVQPQQRLSIWSQVTGALFVVFLLSGLLISHLLMFSLSLRKQYLLNLRL